jgi:hypothetical protein
METNFNRSSDFKKGLGTGEDVTKRHVAKKIESTRNVRKEKLEKKRKFGELIVTTDVGSYILTIDYNDFMSNPNPLVSLGKLANLLKSSEKAEPYYGPDPELYPEQINGPFLFSNDNAIARIIQLARHPDPEISKMAIFCIGCIAGHDRVVHWVNKLVSLGALPVLFESKYGLRALENMCADNPGTRDLILSKGIVPIICSYGPEHWEELSFFFVSLFKHRESVPTYESYAQLWNLMVHKVLLEHYPPGPFEHNVVTAINILHGINLLVRFSNAYRRALVTDVPLIKRLHDWSTGNDLVVTTCAHTLSTLTESEEIQSHLYTMDSMSVFTLLIMYPNAGVRCQAALAMSNLSLNPLFMEQICRPATLHAIRMQCGFSAIFDLLKPLYLTISQTIITAEDVGMQSLFFPKLLPMVDRLCIAMMKLEHTPNVMAKVLEAIRALMRWDMDQTKTALEDSSGLEQIERLAYHQNPIIQTPCETIMKLIDGIMEIE